MTRLNWLGIESEIKREVTDRPTDPVNRSIHVDLESRATLS
jgi:hypothetical protein